MVTTRPTNHAPGGTACGPAGPATGYALLSDPFSDFVGVSMNAGSQSLPSLFAAFKFGKGGMKSNTLIEPGERMGLALATPPAYWPIVRMSSMIPLSSRVRLTTNLGDGSVNSKSG